MVEGGCLCGAVRYSARGEPMNVRVCHCRLCQKAVGASFHARAMFRAEAVEVRGPVGRAHSSPDLRRGFCPSCGTTLFSERISLNALGLTLGSLDDPDAFAPTEHIWVSRKQAWLVLADGLPQHLEGPPA
jgi:hypothetical protein